MNDRNIEVKLSLLDLEYLIDAVEYQMYLDSASNLKYLTDLNAHLQFVHDKYEDYGSDIDSCF